MPSTQEKSWTSEQHEKFLKEFHDIKEIWPKLTEREKKMVLRLARGESVVRNVNQQFEEKSTLTQKAADKITGTVGSISFALWHATLFVLWILINLKIIPVTTPFDPYPFGLLTMIVSLEAIFLSVFVLISQNRQTMKDRLMSNNDYYVNLKTENELRRLSDTIKEVHILEWSNEMYALQREQLNLIKQIASTKR